MSCTIFYKGKLKENADIQNVIELIKNNAKNIDCSIIEKKDSITLLFNQGKTEPLVFDFKNDKIDNFCKWNGIEEKEFYKIFDIFIAIKPYFKSLKVEDYGGFWYIYNTMHKPCKIKRRTELSDNEVKLLERIKANSITELSQIEKDIFNQMYPTAEPYSYNIWRLIVQDVVKVFEINNLGENTQLDLINRTKKIFPSYFGFFKDNSFEHFSFISMKIFVALWVGELLYKDLGIVSSLEHNIRGLDSSIEAAIWGIMSSFLNNHSGMVNGKHSEIDKFMVQQLSCEFYFILNELKDKGKIELELLVSILDYLGFKYIER